MARLRPVFPKGRSKPRVADRRVLNGITFLSRNGLRWCDASREYGLHNIHYNRWGRWGQKAAPFVNMPHASLDVKKPLTLGIC